MIYIANAFSLQMLPQGLQIWVTDKNPAEVSRACRDVPWTSIVGHADTAAIISGQLGFEVPHNRININLQPGDTLYVGQLTGGRLPEGATELPEGFRLEWRRVDIYVGELGEE